MVWTSVLVAAAQFAFVFLKAFQQRSVIHNTRWAVWPTSMAMAFFEVFVYASAASAYISSGWEAAACVAFEMGLGGGAGCLCAMALHDRIMGRR